MNRIWGFVLGALLAGCSSIVEERAFDIAPETYQRAQLSEAHKTEALSKVKFNSIERFKSKEELTSYLNYLNTLKNYREAVHDIDVAKSGGEERIIITGSRIQNQPSITNNQVEGVDEGDIIKKLGDFLIILRHGKLYTVRIEDAKNNELKSVDELNVSPPGLEHEAWYDEILTIDNVVLVIGYSYDLRASEILRFKVSSGGQIRYWDSYLIRTDDYFSDGNYASRIFKGRYISYFPTSISLDNSNIDSFVPKIAKFKSLQTKKLNWQPLIDFNNIIKPIQYLHSPHLHTIINCSPSSLNFKCEATAIIGSENVEYYVSQNNFYLWSESKSKKALLDYRYDRRFWEHLDDEMKEPEQALIHKLNFNDGNVTSAKVQGTPLDQFSFHEFDEKFFITLERNYGEKKKRDLVVIPFERFVDYAASLVEPVMSLADVTDYANYRFSDNYLAFGHSHQLENLDTDKGVSEEYYLVENFDFEIIELNSLSKIHVPLDHSSDRIEKHERSFFVSGINVKGNFEASIIDLDSLAGISNIQLNSILESETRSHAFNAKTYENTSLFGLTTLNKNQARREDAFFYVWDDNQASDVFFLGLDSNNQLYEAGIFVDTIKDDIPDDCEYSCYDWYGNTRPFFIGDRIFGMSGNQIFEGKLEDGKVVLVNHTDIRKKNNKLAQGE